MEKTLWAERWFTIYQLNSQAILSTNSQIQEHYFSVEIFITFLQCRLKKIKGRITLFFVNLSQHFLGTASAQLLLVKIYFYNFIKNTFWLLTSSTTFCSKVTQFAPHPRPRLHKSIFNKFSLHSCAHVLFLHFTYLPMILGHFALRKPTITLNSLVTPELFWICQEHINTNKKSCNDVCGYSNQEPNKSHNQLNNNSSSAVVAILKTVLI